MKHVEQANTKIYPVIFNCIPDGETMLANTQSLMKETLVRTWDAYVHFSKMMAGIYSLNFLDRQRSN